MRKEKVLAVISARAGSKGVPGKNLRLLHGKPLIYYMIAAARRSEFIDRVVFSTEDAEIAEVARDLGAEVPFRRSPELAEDFVPLLSVTQDAMRRMDSMGFRADIVVQLQPTCPLVPTEKIDESVQKILEGADVSVSLKRIGSEHPYRAKEVMPDGSFRPFLKDFDVEKYQSRQELPPLYCTSGAIYTRRREFLESWSGQDFALGPHPQAVILNDYEAINIDRPIDFSLAEVVMKHREELCSGE